MSRIKKQKEKEYSILLDMQELWQTIAHKCRYMFKLQKQKKGNQIMNTKEVKLAISDRTNIPLDMILGSTPEEAFAYSKTLLAYKKSTEEQTEESKEKKFRDYMLGNNFQENNAELNALVELQMELGLRDKYPVVNDCGQVSSSKMPDPRSVSEQFASWFCKNGI